MVMLLGVSGLVGQSAFPGRALQAAPAPAAPTITITTAATGALIRNYGAASALLDLGAVSYFKSASTPGETKQKNSGSFVISTRFALRIDCPASTPSSKANITMSRTDAASSHAITIDGAMLGSAAQILVSSMPCGSTGEHRLDMQVPTSTPAGSIGSTVAFVATINR
jgi:hypothetical protein